MVLVKAVDISKLYVAFQ